MEAYNSKDGAFVEALHKMFDFYNAKKRIDIFEERISVPSLTLRRYLFHSSERTFFCLFPISCKDL